MKGEEGWFGESFGLRILANECCAGRRKRDIVL